MPSLPPGIVAVPPIGNPLTTHRDTSFSYELRGIDLAPTGDFLAGNGHRGHLEWNSARAVKGVGSLAVTDQGQDIDWREVRIAPSMTVNGISWPLGLWVPVLPDDAWDATSLEWSVGLLDVTTILDRGGIRAPYSLPAGANATDAIAGLIAEAGLAASVTPSDKTLATARSWDAGTSRLRIINDLCEIINYFAAFADNNGVIRVDPYVAPQSRPVVEPAFVDGENCIYAPQFMRSQDADAVPTEVVLTTRGTETTPGLWTVFEAPATSPYSAESRGFSITFADQVDAADQPTLDALARAKWIDLASPQATYALSHAPLPLRENQVVAFRSQRAGYDIKAAVASTRIELDPLQFAKLRIREVVEA